MKWDAFLSERPLGVIATTSSDGMPHAVPVEVVVHDGRVYVWCKRRSVKARNVLRDARASLVAYKGNAFVLVRGAARVLDDEDPSYATITALFLAKYEREETFGNDTLIEISPDRIVARPG